jgi:NADPH:quinone reductase-like Zn-dependent oxidoreductase
MDGSMKALVAKGYGPPEEYTVTEVPVPRPGPGQLQVRVAAVSLNPADVRLPGGDFRDMVEMRFPHIPGVDFAGTVTELGAGVTGYAVGDEIFGAALPLVLRAIADPVRPSLSTGALAEYLVCEADTPFLAHRPAQLPVDQAATLPTVGLTAQALLAEGRFLPGESVLAIGATGGVGTAVLPLLAASGARVIATATEADSALIRRLGASEVIDYRRTDVLEEALRLAPGGVDAVLNLTLADQDLAAFGRVFRPGGRLVTIVFPPLAQEALGREDVTLIPVLDMEGRHGGMREVAELATSGALTATIGRRYTFADSARACADFARLHTTGKLLVTLR